MPNLFPSSFSGFVPRRPASFPPDVLALFCSRLPGIFSGYSGRRVNHADAVHPDHTEIECCLTHAPPAISSHAAPPAPERPDRTAISLSPPVSEAASCPAAQSIRLPYTSVLLHRARILPGTAAGKCESIPYGFLLVLSHAIRHHPTRSLGGHPSAQPPWISPGYSALPEASIPSNTGTVCPECAFCSHITLLTGQLSPGILQMRCTVLDFHPLTPSYSVRRSFGFSLSPGDRIISAEAWKGHPGDCRGQVSVRARHPMSQRCCSRRPG